MYRRIGYYTESVEQFERNVWINFSERGYYFVAYTQMVELDDIIIWRVDEFLSINVLFFDYRNNTRPRWKTTSETNVVTRLRPIYIFTCEKREAITSRGKQRCLRFDSFP
jgi:hypothetical protein